MTKPTSPPRGSVEAVLLDLSQLNADKLAALVAAVEHDAFASDVSALSRALGWREHAVSQLLTLLENIYKFLRPSIDDDVLSEANIRVGLIDVISNLEYFGGIEPNVDDVITRLVPLVKFNPTAEMQRKEEVLKKSGPPFATAFSTVVDLRPLLSIDRKNVERFLTAIQFKISTDRRGADDMVFQIDVDDIAKMREALDVLEQKLLTLQAHSPSIGN
jgi:hypothetical protein